MNASLAFTPMKSIKLWGGAVLGLVMISALVFTFMQGSSQNETSENVVRPTQTFVEPAQDAELDETSGEPTNGAVPDVVSLRDRSIEFIIAWQSIRIDDNDETIRARLLEFIHEDAIDNTLSIAVDSLPYRTSMIANRETVDVEIDPDSVSGGNETHSYLVPFETYKTNADTGERLTEPVPATVIVSWYLDGKRWLVAAVELRRVT